MVLAVRIRCYRVKVSHGSAAQVGYDRLVEAFYLSFTLPEPEPGKNLENHS